MDRRRVATSLRLVVSGAALALAVAGGSSASAAVPVAPGQELRCESDRGVLVLAADQAQVQPRGVPRPVVAQATYADRGGVWDVAIATQGGQRFAFQVRQRDGAWELGIAGAWSPCTQRRVAGAPAPTEPPPGVERDRAEGPPLPQECHGVEDFGGLVVGSRVQLGRHRPVGGQDNWAAGMDPLVGVYARVTELAGLDESGCPGVRVDADAGKYFWRLRDLGVTGRAEAAPAPVEPAPAPPTPAPSERTAGVEARVQLFSTSWCPACKSARRYLQTAKIPFEEIDIETEDGRARFDDTLRGAGKDPSGYSSIPVIVVDGREVMVGFSQGGLASALNARH